MSQAAFPHIDTDEHGRIYTYQTGMTLRDYFAAKAMQAIIGNRYTGVASAAEDAYEVADAMLKARDE